LAAVAVELVKEDAAKRLHYNKKHIFNIYNGISPI
jgi:hypothetical protein